MFSLTLQNRYRIEDELGVGGMGTVYRAHDTLLDRAIALKLLGDPALGPESRERLLREARAAARLNHPNIVSIYDVGGADDASDLPFIVMEMVEGQSLYDQPPATIAETITIARQICAALDHAHSHGIVHRDLKLENILIAKNGTVKLTDFGLARSVTSRLTAEGTVLGTVFYLAPELALGQPFDGRADLYALGVLLYELTTHRLPFDGDDPLAVVSQHLHAPVVPPRAHAPEIPPALDSLIVRLLSKRADDRPATAAEVKTALERITGETEAQPKVESDGDYFLLDRLVRGRMVGRERELAEARALWRKAAAGEPNVLLISGEPGIGKSRLTREFMALAEVSGASVWVGECYAEGGAPYAPIAQFLQSALAHTPPLPASISSLVLADLITLAPALRARFPDAPPNPALDPLAEQQRIFESVTEWCLALAERAPLLLVLDDVHWADSGALALLRHLARRNRAARARVLIVLTYREVELAENHPLNDTLIDFNRERLVSRIKLGRLNRDQTGAMLAVMFEEEITPEFLDGIYRETEGNPFFVEEVCKALVEEGQVVYAEGQWRRPDMSQLRVPQSIRVAIQGRVSKLPEPAQEILRLAAAFGREFEFDLLQRASEAGEEALIESLEHAARAQLINEARARRSGSETFVFAHALIPAALRESVSGLRRHRLHRRAAAAIESARPDDFEALAYQYAEAGDEDCARTCYVSAGARAQKVYANHDAIKFYIEALALFADDDPDRFEVLLARAAVYDVIANRDAQRKDAEAMLALAETLNDDSRRFDALLALADVFVETDEFRAREPAARALAIAQALGDKVREAHALRRVGWLELLQQEYSASRSALETAIAQFRAAGRQSEAAACLHILSLCFGRWGRLESARKAVEESIALSRAIGDRRHEAIGLRRLGIMCEIDGQTAEGIKHAELALALHREMGDRSQELNALANLAGAHGQIGQWEEAKRYSEQTIELAEAIDSTEGLAKGISLLTVFYLRATGDFGAALAYVNATLEKERVKNDSHLLLKMRLVQGMLLASLGQYRAVLDVCRNLEMAPEKFGRAAASEFWGFVAVLHAELGEFLEARRALAQAAGYLGPNNTPAEHANVLGTSAYVDLLEGLTQRDANARQKMLNVALEKGRQVITLLDSTAAEGIHEFRGLSFEGIASVHLELGDTANALSYSTRAVELLEQRPILWMRAPEQILYTHSRALRAAGRVDDADGYLRRAHERVMLVANSLNDEALRRSWLENVRVNRMMREE